jgi:hypothetical protein
MPVSSSPSNAAGANPFALVAYECSLTRGFFLFLF